MCILDGFTASRRPEAGAAERLAVDLSGKLTFDTLIERVEAARARPMKIIELAELADNGDALCGLWLATEDTDIVVHAPSDSTLHRQQFVLHELAHMMLMHDRDDGIYTPRHLLPDLPGATVVKALARDDLNSSYELDAEALADELAARLRRDGRSRFFDVFG